MRAGILKCDVISAARKPTVATSVGGSMRLGSRLILKTNEDRKRQSYKQMTIGRGGVSLVHRAQMTKRAHKNMTLDLTRK